MRKFFGFGKKDTKTEEKLNQAKEEMKSYQGQKFNQAEDQNITTESLFKVIDKDNGEVVDIRELLGITEEDFKNNPELAQVLKMMNNIDPVEEESKDGPSGSNVAKKRLRRLNYDIIGTDEFLGATANLTEGNQDQVNWGQWWERKDRINTLLIEAIQKQNIKQITELLNEQTQMYGVVADLNHRLDYDETPLHMAVKTNNIESVQILLRFFAEVNAQSSTGIAPLHVACQAGSLPMVKILVKNFASIDIQDEEGNTPLHTACFTMNAPIIIYLVDEAGADGQLQNLKQKTPYQTLLDRCSQTGKQDQFKKALASLQKSTVKQQMNVNLLKGKNDGKISLNDFLIIDKLGKGSFGSVYLVRLKNDPTERNYAMKILEKHTVFSQNLLKYAKTERNVLCLANHQFIIGLEYAFQTESRFYLVMQFAAGGDMGMALAKHRRFDLDVVRIYAAEVLLALEYLHFNSIVFRDLKPDNVVFDAEGHCLLTDFGLSKENMGPTTVSNSFCGSVAYLAPEMLKRAGHTKSIDWYLLGVLIYEMLVGVPPYFNPDKAQLFKNIESGPLKIPHTMPQQARSLILLLLNRNSAKRLGANQPDAQELKSHEFFEGLDWEKLARKEYPVLQPKCKVHTAVVQSAVQMYEREEQESEQKFLEWAKANKEKLQDKPTWVDGWSFTRVREFIAKDLYTLIHSTGLEQKDSDRLARQIFSAADTNADGFLDRNEQIDMIEKYCKTMATSKENSQKDWVKEKEFMLNSYFQEMTNRPDQKVSLHQFLKHVIQQD